MKKTYTVFSVIAAVLAMPPGVFADTNAKAIRDRMAAETSKLDGMLAEVKDGTPTEQQHEAINAQMQSIERAKILMNAIEHSERMREIPEGERLDYLGLSGSEKKDLDKITLGGQGGILMQAMRNGRVEGVFLDMRQEAEREAQNACVALGNPSGFAMPARAMDYLKAKAAARFRNAAQSVGGSNLGSQFVPTQLMGEYATSSALATPVMVAAGVRELRGLVGNVDVPTIAYPTTASAVLSETASATELDAATSKKSMVPKRIPVFFSITDQLVMQSSPDIENILLQLILEKLAVEKDARIITGTDLSTGINSASGVGSVAGGTNGLAPTWAHLVALENAVADVNAIGSRYITNTKVRGKLKTTPRQSSGVEGNFLWGDNNQLNGYPVSVSNVVPSNLTKGTSSGVCSEIIFGDFSTIWLGYWGGMMIENPRDVTAAKTGTSTVVVTEFYDVGILAPFRLATMKDALTA